MSNHILEATDCGPGKSSQLSDIPSPSQSLLQRLKELREYQAHQRALLLQVQSGGPMYLPVTTSQSTTETPADQIQIQDLSSSHLDTSTLSQDRSETTTEHNTTQSSTHSHPSSFMDQSATQTSTHSLPSSLGQKMTETPGNDTESRSIDNPETRRQGEHASDHGGGDEQDSIMTGRNIQEARDLTGGDNNEILQDEQLSLSRPPACHPQETLAIKSPDEEREAYWSNYKTKRHFSSQESLASSGHSPPFSSDTGLATWPSGRSVNDDQFASSVPLRSSVAPQYPLPQRDIIRRVYSQDPSDTDYTEEFASETSATSSTSGNYTSARDSSASLEPDSATFTSSHGHATTSRDCNSEADIAYHSERYNSYPSDGNVAWKSGVENPYHKPVRPAEEPALIEEPKVKFRFLKRGEGTSRFGMKPSRLKKSIKVDEIGNPPRQSKMSAVESGNPMGSQISAVDVEQIPPAHSWRGKVRLPVKQLKLKGMPPLSKPTVLEENPKSLLKFQSSTNRHTRSSQPHTDKRTRSNPSTDKQGRGVSSTQTQAMAPGHRVIEMRQSHTNTRPPPPHTDRNTRSTSPHTDHNTRPPLSHTVSDTRPTPDTNSNTRQPHIHHNNKPPPPHTGEQTQVPMTPDFEKQRRKEDQQLSAFERLEKLVDDSSFSSSSSTVCGLLKQGQHSISSTPVRTPPPFSPKETPVHGVLGRNSMMLEMSAGKINLLNRMLQAGLNDGNTTTYDPIFEEKMLLGSTDVNSQALGSQQPEININEVLQQLKAIVRLKGQVSSEISEADVREFLESFSDHPSLATPEAALRFAASVREISSTAHPTSTPSDPPTLQSSPSTPPAYPRPRVHFGSEAVEVREYELSDVEDTLTDATSLAEDDSDLLSASDMELLTQYINEVPVIAPRLQAVGMVQDPLVHKNNNHLLARLSEESEEDVTLTPETPSPDHTPMRQARRGNKNQQPIALEFSPPSPRPENCASNYIYSIFGKDRDATKGAGSKKIQSQPRRQDGEDVPSQPSQENPNKRKNSQQGGEKVNTRTDRKEEISDEIEAHKTLLLAKVAQLESETRIFQRENAKLAKLQQEVEEERQRLAEERAKLQEATTRERKRLQEYVDRERNALWKEKQGASRHGPSISSAKENSLEIVYLKEQLHDMKEEAKRKDSLHQFNIKKLNERIRILEDENRQLKNKNVTLQNLEKENLDLRCKLNRAKISVRSQQASTLKPKSANGNVAANLKARTVDGVNRSLDKLTRPQIKIVKEHEASGKLNKYYPQSDEESVVPLEGRARAGDVFGDRNGRGSGKVEEGGGAAESESDTFGNIYVAEKITLATRQPPELMLRGRAITNNSRRQTELPSPNKHVRETDVMLDAGQIANLPVTADDNANANPGMRQYESLPGDLRPTDNAPNMQGQGHTSRDEQSLDFFETVKEDGTWDIIYANGNKKEIRSDGTTIVNYYNGDRKEVWPDRVVYVYGTDQTSHTTFDDGREVLVFPNGQTETRCLDGSSEITFPDGSRKLVTPDGVEMCSMENGTVVRTNPDGSKIFEFPNGQREVHEGGEKRREYPDGTKKILYSDGRTETIYRTGRRRVKDADGNLLLDTHSPHT